VDWRDQHRKQGRFKPRPGAKGFAEDAPRPDKPAGERRPFAIWVAKTRNPDGDDPKK
jgi:hypothetical protein